jgi:type IV pilus biogenesis protein CpaD/CtpE
MTHRPFLSCLLLALSLTLSACGKADPQAQLEAAVQKLQDNLEAKDTSAVIDQLDVGFQAQEGMDQDAARKTMTLLFLRYANVKVIAVTRKSSIDPTAPQSGLTQAQVLVTGAQGLIPERAAPYEVRMEWRRVSDDWKLARITWE